MQLGLDTTAAQLMQLDATSDEPMDRKVAEFMAGLSISYDVKSAKPLGKTEAKDIIGQQVAISGPAGELLELRIVGEEALYLRADIEQVADLAGEDVPPMNADEVPPGMEAIGELFEGEWVKVDLQQAKELNEEMRKDGAGLPVQPDFDEKTGKKLLASVKKAFKSEIKLKDKGSENGVDHVVASAGAQDLLLAVLDSVRPYAKDLGMPGGELPKKSDLKELGKKKVAVDIFIKDGKLKTVSTDVAKLADEAEGDELVIRADFGAARSVKAPENAAELDLAAMMEAFMSEMGAPEGEF